MHRGKVDPGVSELPRGNELSWDHVNRPLVLFEQSKAAYLTKGLFTWTRDSELPRGNHCPGASVTSRSRDDLLSRGNVAPGQLHCPGASSSKSDHYEFI